MKVTNGDIKAVKFAIAKLQEVSLDHQKYDKTYEITLHKHNLILLKKKLIDEFSISEFPELKEPH